MRMNRLLILLCCITVVHGGFAQDANEEAKKNLFNAFRLYEVKSARYGGVTVPGEYITDGDRITGQYYLSSSYSTDYKPGNLCVAGYAPNPSYPSVFMKNGNCTSEGMDFSRLVITTPAPGITRLEDKGFAINGHSNKVREFYTVEYGADNRVTSVNEGYIVLDKKTGAPVFEYFISETTYSWTTGTDVTVTSTHYYDKKKAKDDHVKISSHTYHHIIEKNRLQTSDEFGRDLLYTTSGKETTIQSRKKNTNDAYKLSNKFTTDGEKVVKSEYYEYNDQTGVLEKKTITDYTFEKNSNASASNTDICTFNRKSFTSVYDAQGNLTREITEGKFREKNPDGSWTEWKLFRL